MYSTKWMAYANSGFTTDEFDAMDSDIHDFSDTTPEIKPSSKVTEKPSGCFTFIDFCPEYRRKPDAWFFQTDYETFSDLFHKINDWLRDNPKWEVKTAETLIYDSSTGFGQRLPFLSGRHLRKNLRAVRLWLTPRLHQRNSPQKIGCINVVPRIKISCGEPTTLLTNGIGDTPSSSLSQTPIFETLDEMLVRVNDLLSTKPLNGRILNVETVPIPITNTNWNIDSECSYWSDEYQKNNNTIFILRIYFEYGTVTRERLEIIDFVPQVHIWDAPLAVPNFESFSSLLTRSSQWLKEQPLGLRFLSCHTVEAPLDYELNADSIRATLRAEVESIQSKKMFYSRMNSRNQTSEFSLKFLRIAVAKPQESCPESHFPPTRETVILNCKIFVPTKLPNLNNGDYTEYESINISKRKIEAWLMATGARILSAETTVITVPYASSSIATAVDCCLKNHSPALGHYLVVYRIYLNGHYLEPPARLLPANLNVETEVENGSCNIM